MNPTSDLDSSCAAITRSLKKGTRGWVGSLRNLGRTDSLAHEGTKMKVAAAFRAGMENKGRVEKIALIERIQKMEDVPWTFSEIVESVLFQQPKHRTSRSMISRIGNTGYPRGFG